MSQPQPLLRPRPQPEPAPEHLVFIEPHGATAQHLQELHRKLAVFGVAPWLTDRHGVRERLPPGVYHHRGTLAPELLRAVVQGCVHLAAPAAAEGAVEAAVEVAVEAVSPERPWPRALAARRLPRA